ncbi:MAG TPA: ParA family protein [Acetobacteraceae bacterium]|nr:ParA family protein [Acetobacteraceae bacterium]
MTKIIAVAQQKGGAGKTMLVSQLGVALAMGRRVALLDIDPQGSLTAWFRLRGAAKRAQAPVSLESVAGWRLVRTLDALAAAHDLVLIDTPPVLDADARRAIRAADMVLVPLNPAPPDYWAAEGTLKLASEEKRRIALVFNRAPAASRLRKEMEAKIRARGIELLPALGNRAAYANAFADGLGVTESGPATQAGTEMRILSEALLSALE